MNEKIWLSSPHMGGSERKYVEEAFDTNWIAPLGPNVNGFEQDISDFLNARQPVGAQTAVLTSGTAALHLALVMLDVRPGDVVLAQSFTFCGTTNPIIYQGAEVIFIDSEADTWNMCPDALEEAIITLVGEGYVLPEANVFKRTIRAIIPVHLYGMPAKLDEIQAIADNYQIPLVEDAAEALGSYYKQRACGTFGAMAALSFNGNKIITTSGGGALVSTQTKFVEQSRFLSTQARDNAAHYQHSKIGYNYRMSNVVAGIGRGQMEVLETRVEQRRANNQRYRTFFADVPGITFQNEPNADFYSNFWLTSILVDPKLTGGLTREDIRLALEAENIEARPLWKPMHMQPVFEGSRFFGPGICKVLFEHGLCLPSGSNLSDEDFERIFKALKSIVIDK
ncbi:MAG: aminotransferase class I/II-fold pyridoxal phosphate-dependent enzyme [Cryomorphaceae bacterium]|nr:aminotransferase class I/II-fold pyridoxal phosphate-dependent enzyme [Cryomorphaceae bacterium]